MNRILLSAVVGLALVLGTQDASAGWRHRCCGYGGYYASSYAAPAVYSSYYGSSYYSTGYYGYRYPYTAYYGYRPIGYPGHPNSMLPGPPYVTAYPNYGYTYHYLYPGWGYAYPWYGYWRY